MGTKTGLKNVENKIPDSNAFVEKTDSATMLHYVTNAALTIQLNNLKSQHISDEV